MFCTTFFSSDKIFLAKMDLEDLCPVFLHTGLLFIFIFLKKTCFLCCHWTNEQTRLDVLGDSKQFWPNTSQLYVLALMEKQRRAGRTLTLG